MTYSIIPNAIEMWKNSKGELHRKDGPAIVRVNGDKEWYQDGLRHREDGPAVELADGYKAWYRNGNCHREDGPAIELASGVKHWYRNGELHREDGPAIECAETGMIQYWVDAKIPTTILDLIITDRPMIFDGQFLPNVKYFSPDDKAYRFTDPDELALAILYYT